MNIHSRDHRGGLRELDFNIEAVTNKHDSLSQICWHLNNLRLKSFRRRMRCDLLNIWATGEAC